MTEKTKSLRKTREGIVVSAAMEKTVVVKIERLFRHTQYGKVIRRNKKVKVHDEKGCCIVGDVIRIEESRPISKGKHWRYVETIRKAVVV